MSIVRRGISARNTIFKARSMMTADPQMPVQVVVSVYRSAH